jgi:endonuclease-3
MEEQAAMQPGTGRKPARSAGKKKASRAWKGPLASPETVKALLRGLARAYPKAECALEFENPLELLVATILSAQCTDERVNQVTRALFRKYRKPADYAEAPPGVLEGDIRSTGFFNNKAKSIRGAAAMIRDRFGGNVPRKMEELLILPGVARKTANVILGTAFKTASGIVVDTHVTRLAQRMGLTLETAPDKIEADLMRRVPRRSWIVFGHRMILHGRRVCQARKPACGACPLASHCPSFNAFQ